MDTRPYLARLPVHSSGNDLADVPTLVEALRSTLPPDGPRDRQTLTVLGGPLIGTLLRLSGTEVILGRSGVAAIRFQDESISRRHARVFHVEGAVYIEDLRSSSGTFLNGKRLDAPARLEDGDQIGLGPDRTVRYALLDSSQEEAAVELYEATVRDVTTGAYNRRHFDRRFAEEETFVTDHGGSLALLLLDVDDMKSINDTHGHRTGDLVLRLIAASVQRLLRPEDVLVRYGGDEFVVLCRSTTERNGIILAERIRKSVEQLRFTSAGADVRLTASVGVASETTARGPGLLVAEADRAMYRAKREGAAG
jgi:diguanylate cyclase (GGDEF)-like protein